MKQNKNQPSQAFVKEITAAGVNRKDAQNVYSAVLRSPSSLVYDVQLRACIFDKDKAADIYAKTKNIFDKLKKII